MHSNLKPRVTVYFCKSTLTGDFGQEDNYQADTLKQRPIVFLTSSLVYCSLSRLIPDFCFCSSSLCINCPIIPLTKVTFSGGEEATPFLITGECWRATCPTYRARKCTIKSKYFECKHRGKQSPTDLQPREICETKQRNMLQWDKEVRGLGANAVHQAKPIISQQYQTRCCWPFQMGFASDVQVEIW